MKKAQGLMALAAALPPVLIVFGIDQISKYQAIEALCRFGSPAQGCSALDGIRLIEAGIYSAGRFPTFLPIIDLEFHLNTNAALSMPIPGPVWFEYLLLITIMVLLAGWLWREGGRHNIIGVGLILGGAIGNFVDRLVHGAVVDFLALHLGPWQFFIFNIADAAITLGVGWLFVEQLFLKQRRNAQAVVS